MTINFITPIFEKFHFLSKTNRMFKIRSIYCFKIPIVLTFTSGRTQGTNICEVSKVVKSINRLNDHIFACHTHNTFSPISNTFVLRAHTHTHEHKHKDALWSIFASDGQLQSSPSSTKTTNFQITNNHDNPHRAQLKVCTTQPPRMFAIIAQHNIVA